MKINLPCFGIEIILGKKDKARPGAYLGGEIASNLNNGNDDPELKVAMDAVESLILAHAVAGVDVQSPAFVEGIETAVETCLNKFS